MDIQTETNLPANLALLRKKSGLTQVELAERLGVSRQAISKWEVGTAVPSIESLVSLSALYGVTVDSLLKGCPEDSGESAPQAQTPNPQEGCTKGKIRWLIPACVVFALFLAAVAGLALFARQDREYSDITPIYDLNVSDGDDYPTWTFSFEHLGEERSD